MRERSLAPPHSLCVPNSGRQLPKLHPLKLYEKLFCLSPFMVQPKDKLRLGTDLASLTKLAKVPHLEAKKQLQSRVSVSVRSSSLRQAQDRQAQGERILTLALLAFPGGLQSEWLPTQVGERAPQPFHRAVVESSHPQHA